MMQGMLRFTRGLFLQPLPVRLWVYVLVLMNLAGALVFIGHYEARVVLGVFLVGGLLMGAITSVAGFTRLLGLGHFLWFPLLAWLATRLGEIPADEPYGMWIRALMLINGTSLVIDVVDVVRYLAGDREETVDGLG